MVNQAVPASSESELDANAKTYGTKIAAIRGNFHEENDRYVFTNGVAALSNPLLQSGPAPVEVFLLARMEVLRQAM